MSNEVIYPSAVFDNDSKYLQFLDNILSQTEEAADNPTVAFFIPANAMLQKKYLHDFLLETKRRCLVSQSERIGGR